MNFPRRPLDRQQAVLFPERLDEAIPPDHGVRLLDELLERIDWRPWFPARQREVKNQKASNRGRPPIHPRIIASVILYGFLRRIFSSRDLEEAIHVRLDFRWLAHGTNLDHSTICNFRVDNDAPLKDLFIQVVQIAAQMGHLPLASLGYDATRIKANNRRSGTRTPEQLRQLQAELGKQYDQATRLAEQADAEQTDLLGQQSRDQLPESLRDIQARKSKVEAAIEELNRIKERGLKEPARLPITDPQSRVAKNKEGGFAPNYTPTAMVDIDSGIVVDADVVFGHNEDRDMLGAIDAVQQNLGLEKPVPEVLADGLMSSGENIVGCKERGVDFKSPINLRKNADNPAIREDLTQPVAAQDQDRLPRRMVTAGGKKLSKLDKEAFVFVPEEDHYRCPQGKVLPRCSETTERENGRDVIRHHYQSQPEACQGCPLMAACVDAKTGRRRIRHTHYEADRIEHAEKMATDEAQKKYARRRAPGERPFAMIKQHFGLRQFTVRGRRKVVQQWRWSVTAFNLHRLMSLIQSNADPPPQPSAA